MNTRRNMKVHKTLRRCPGRLLRVLCTFSLCFMSRGESAFVNFNEQKLPKKTADWLILSWVITKKSILVPLAKESIHKYFKMVETSHEIDLGNEKKILTGIKYYHDPVYYNDVKNIKIYVYSRVGFNEFDYVDYEDIMLDWKGVR